MRCIGLYLLMVFLSSVTSLVAQNPHKSLDSLRLVLDSSEGKDRVLVLNQLAWEKRNSHFSQSIGHLEESIEIAQKIRFSKGLAQAYNFRGVVYRNLDALKSAMQSFVKAKNVAQEHELMDELAYSYNNIGDLYHIQGDLSGQDLKNIQKAINLFKKSNNQRGLAYAYLRQGEVLQSNLELEKAEASFKKSLNIRRHLSDPNAYATSLQRLGQISLKNGDNYAALMNFNEAYQIFKDQKDIRGLIGLQIDLAKYFLDNRELDESEKLIKIALDSIQSYKLKDYKKDALEIMVSLAENKEDYYQALEYQRQLNAVKDSLSNRDIIELASKLEAVHELEQNQLEVKAQKERVFWQNIIIVVGAVSLVLILLFTRSQFLKNKEKQRQNILLSQSKNEIEQNHQQLSNLYEEVKTQKEALDEQAQELQRLNQVKDKFFSMSSHDIRGPLNSLKGMLELYNLGGVSNEEIQHITKELARKLEGVSSFLENLLHWSKSQMQGLELSPGYFNVHDLCQATLSLLSPQADQKSIVLNYQNKDSNLDIYADENKLAFVLRNLLSNAIKFTPTDGNIYLTVVGKPSDMLWFQVQDTGIGMDPEIIPRIFSLENYTRPGTHDEKGTGIGLLLCKEFVEVGGGEIWVDSKVNQGSTFHFTVPKKLDANLEEV